MQKVEIRLLGPSTIFSEGEFVSIPRRIPRVLLFYLAATGNLVNRDTILDLFWETGARKSRLRLSENLSRLRAALPDSQIVISYDNHIGLDFEKVFVDVIHFRNLLDLAGRKPWQIPEDKPLPSQTKHHLTEANNLWQGPYALQGIKTPSPKLDNWLQLTAEHLHTARYNILIRLADHEIVLGNFTTALALALTAQEYNNFSEALHLKIMDLLVKTEQIDEARQYFEETREMMSSELNASPSPKMIKLYQKIRCSGNQIQAEIEPKWEVHPSADVPFVGRRAAMNAIDRAIKNNQGIVILGESGQGKTRLVQEHIAKLDPQPRVLIGNCRSTERSLPFHPIIEVLRRYVMPDEWLALPTVWGNYLSELMPELTQMREDLDPNGLAKKDSQSQALLFESIRQIFLLLNQNHAIYLVIDDAHWADEATLSTLAYLLTRDPFTNSASMALIARFEELDDSLHLMIDSIQQSKHASVYQLGHLRREYINDLIHHFLESEPSDQFIDRLLADTGGNTFFVLEILRAINESEEQNIELETELPITDDLQNLLNSRIRKLSSNARNTLEVAAIIGPEFSIQVLGRSCFQPPDKLATILKELENNLLVRPYQKRQDELYYQFTHEKIRETLLNRIQPTYAQILHVRVVNALSLHQKPEAGVLAHHYRGAGELKLAFQYWIKAAKRAHTLFAEEDASRNYEHAEDLIGHIESDLLDQEFYDFYSDWADLAYNINRTELLTQIGNRLIEIGETRDNHTLIGTGLSILSNASFTINDFQGGLDFANQAIRHLDQSENTFEHIEAYNHKGALLYMLNRLDEAVIAFQDALALSTEKSDPKIDKARSNSHYQTALLRTLKGTPNSGYSHGIKALEYAELSQHTYSIVQAYAIQALSQFYMGKFYDAYENAITGIELAERTQAWRMLGYLHSYASMAEVATGHLDPGRKHAVEAIQIGTEFGHNDVIALGYRQLGELHRLLYDHSNAAAYHQNGIEAAGEHFTGLDNLYRLGLVKFFLGDPSGNEDIEFACDLLRKNRVCVGVIAAKTCLALISASSNQWSLTRQLASELEVKTLNGGLASFNVSAILLSAEAAFAEEELDTALENFQFAAGEAQFIKNPWLEIKARVGIHRVNTRLALETTQTEGRISDLIDQLESHTNSSDTKAVIASLRRKILDSPSIDMVTL